MSHQNLNALLKGNEQIDPIVSPLVSKSSNRGNSHRLVEVMERERSGLPVNVLVIPSLSLEGDLLKGIVGISHYETRSLWQILRSNNPNTQVIFVTSSKIFNEGIDHLLSFFPEKEKMRSQIKFVALDDDRSEQFLTEKILDRPDIQNKIKNLLGDTPSYMTTFMTTEKEEELANKLELPLLGPDSRFCWYLSKSGNHEIFKEAQSLVTDAISDLHSTEELIQAIEILWQRNPKAFRFMVKLDYGVSGKGNALLTFDKTWSQFNRLDEMAKSDYLLHRLRQMKFQGSEINWSNFSKKFPEGLVLEKFIEGHKKVSPSCQALILPSGEVEILSTHEQILDESGMVFLGSEFPANRFHRKTLQEETLKVGKKMAEKGIVGYFALDFLVTIDELGNRQNFVIEINLRQGGTTHPYQVAKYLSESAFSLEKGILLDRKGRHVYYRSNDNFHREDLKGRDFSDLLEKVKDQDLLFNSERGAGIVFHMMTALYDHGKIGYTAISHSRKEANQLHLQLEKLLKNI